MNMQLHDPIPLTALPPAERTRALARYRILQPCIEHAVPVPLVAHQQGVPLRTVERWLARYRREGLVGLAHRRRRDRGHRRCVVLSQIFVCKRFGMNRPG
jgi:putative transposase